MLIFVCISLTCLIFLCIENDELKKQLDKQKQEYEDLKKHIK